MPYSSFFAKHDQMTPDRNHFQIVSQIAAAKARAVKNRFFFNFGEGFNFFHLERNSQPVCFFMQILHEACYIEKIGLEFCKIAMHDAIAKIDIDNFFRRNVPLLVQFFHSSMSIFAAIYGKKTARRR